MLPDGLQPTRRPSGLPPSGRTPNDGSSSRLRSGLDVGGAMRTRALLAAPTIALAVAAIPPAAAGGERAVGSRGRQFIDKNFNGPQMVSAEPDRGGVGRLTDPRPGPPVISPDGSHVVVDRWQAACLLEQHPRGVSCAH